jgi:hypothetical protein
MNRGPKDHRKPEPGQQHEPKLHRRLYCSDEFPSEMEDLPALFADRGF